MRRVACRFLAATAFARGPTGRPFASTSLLFGRTIPFKLADIGEGIQEVQVLEVKVKAGDSLKEFDNICAVQSDKATVDITSRYTGVVKKVYVTVGKTAKVGEPLVDIEVAEDGAAAPAAAERAAPASKAPAAAPSPAGETARSASQLGRKALSTPATRYLAKQHGVDLDHVPATGKGGRVTKDDLHHFMTAKSGAASSSAATPSSPAAPVAAATAAAAAARPAVVGEYGGIKAVAGDEVVSIAGVRRGMAKTMTAAASVPMFGVAEEFDMGNLMALRESLKGSVKARSRGAVKLSFMPFFIKSCSLALSQHPDINALCPEDCSVLIRKKEHNIGFAMDTPNGLVVPVVKDVANKSLYDIAVDLQTLINKGKENKLTTEDFTGGTFSISNVGAIGGLYPTPTVMPPQVAIAALGRTRVEPRFDHTGENIVKANIMTVGFTADHRVLDGAAMVRFCNTWKGFVENPASMLLDAK